MDASDGSSEGWAGPWAWPRRSGRGGGVCTRASPGVGGPVVREPSPRPPLSPICPKVWRVLVVMGVAIRSTRSLDPYLADSPVWRVEVLADP
jgi:hypothetical protein